MASEPDGEEESRTWARQRAQELGIILIKSDAGYKGVKQRKDKQFTAESKEARLVTRVLSGSFHSAEAAALALALHEAEK